MEKKKILYSLVCIGGFAIAFVGLRIITNAFMGIGGILICIYGLLEATHAFTATPSKKSESMYAPLDKDESSEPTCPYCGAPVPKGNDFCGKCGKKISE